MEFPREYFEDEVREGFYVSSMMKCFWAAQLEVLEEVDRVCRKHGIRWFADCGTLLGAVRHGGYIPWDDDLDICMLRDDYMKFAEIAPKELPEGYIVATFDGEREFWNLLMRVVRGDRIDYTPEVLRKYHGCPYVVGIDIFPIDYVCPDPVKEEERRKLVGAIFSTGNLLDCEVPPSKKEMEELIREIERLTGKRVDRKGDIKLQLYRIADSYASMYGPEGCSEVVLMPYWVMYENHKYKLDWFKTAIDIPFETTTLKAPAMYDAVLRVEYGDYMRIVKGGGTHDYPAYGLQEDIVLKELGKIPYKYSYNKDDLKEVERGMANREREQALDFATVMKSVSGKLELLISAGEGQTAVDLLTQCQEGAINTGGAIERVKGEGFICVKYLEEFCEAIYLVNEAVFAGDRETASAGIKLMLEKITEFEESVKKDLHNKKEAVFLPYKASMWDSLESVWLKYRDDPEWDTYVIPIPYYDKNPDGTVREEHYEADQYPEDVPVIHYEQYNFEARHPEEIYIHNPYDECNYVTTVHPFFYSKNLKKFTDKLIYIPYFVLDEIDPDDFRAVKTMEHFVTVPGVIHADEVRVQSEAMKKAYVENLCEFAGEDTREIWEKKIIGSGSPKFDSLMRRKAQGVELPEEWEKLILKPDGSRKKVVLYNTSVSALLEHNAAMTEKIKRVFEVFKENREEVTLLWRPHPLIKATISSMRPELWNDYEKLVEEYKKSGLGIYDDSPDLDRAIAASDAYYGDPSSVVTLCRRCGIPVMIQNPDC